MSESAGRGAKANPGRPAKANPAKAHGGDPFAPSEPVRRHEARQRAIEMLYESEMKQCDPAQVVNSRPVKIDPRARALIEGVCNNQTSIDERLSQLLMDGWTVERLASCDRWILRLGVFELMDGTEPVSVVLSEAVALAQTYGATANSVAFVNGVLAAAARQ